MQYRDFRLYGAADLACIESFVSTAFEKWWNHWFAANSVDCSPHVRPCGEQDVANFAWQGIAPYRAGSPMVVMTGNWRDGIVDWIFADSDSAQLPSAAGDIEAGLLQALISDLLCRLEGDDAARSRCSARIDSATIPVEAGCAGSGYVVVDLVIGDVCQLHLLLWPAFISERIGLAAGSPRKRDAIVAPTEALEEQRIPLTVTIGPGSLTVEELATLSVDDVIVLEQKLHANLAVSMGGGQILCRGNLGSRDGKIAVQLTSNLEN